MKKITYQYLIEELNLSPEQIQEIVQVAQQGFGKDLMNTIKNYTKTYGSRFLKWAKTDYPEDKKVKRRGHK